VFFVRYELQQETSENLKYDCKLAADRDKWRAVVSTAMNLRAARTVHDS